MSSSPERPIDASLVRTLPPRTLTGTFWHQGSPNRPLLSFASPAVADGRYHREGEPGAWYASSKERTAWAEMLRHLKSGRLSASEVRRRIGRVHTEELQVLDLTDEDTRRRLGVSVRELTGDDRSVCQEIAKAARDSGFDAILAPSAAVRGESTLVIFPRGMAKVEEENSRVRRPPSAP